MMLLTIRQGNHCATFSVCAGQSLTLTVGPVLVKMKGKAAASPINAISPPATRELRDVVGTRLLMLHMHSCIKIKISQDAAWAVAKRCGFKCGVAPT